MTFRSQWGIGGVAKVKTILMTVMLVLVAIAIYTTTIGGAGGSLETVRNTGGKMNETIQRIDP